MRRSCNEAVKSGLIMRNPVSGISLIKENNEVGRTLSINEFHQLENPLPSYLLPISRLAFFAGMRKGEILNLTRGMVDESPGYISLKSSQTKTQRARLIPVGKELTDMLENLQPPTFTPDDKVFFLRKVSPYAMRIGIS